MNHNYQIKIKMIERRSWSSESMVAICDDFEQAKKYARVWEKKLADMIWNDSSLILDPLQLYYEVELKTEEYFFNASFDSLKVLKRWLRSVEIK